MPTDLKIVDGDLAFTDANDAATVSGEANAKQQIAAAVGRQTDTFAGSGGRTATAASRLEGQIRSELRDHEYVDRLVDVIVDLDGGDTPDSLAVTITLASREITIEP